jgi:riboflavin biosynthesis pyrimidine reductase
MRILLPEGDSPDSARTSAGMAGDAKKAVRTDGAKGGDADANGSTEVDLHAHYGRGWLAEGGMRFNFITSIDGGATANGKSKGLQTPGDNAVFGVLRDLADVILVGASTASIENYQPSAPSARRRALRERHGFAPAPAIAVLSGSLNLNLEAPLYQNPAGEAPTIVITSSAAPIARRTDIIDLAASGAGLQLLETPALGNGEVDIAAALDALRNLGYRRILCEGGPRVFAASAQARSIDELCLSVSPMLAGPGGPRIVSGPSWPESFLPQLRLVGLLAEDDALFCRYTFH